MCFYPLIAVYTTTTLTSLATCWPYCCLIQSSTQFSTSAWNWYCGRKWSVSVSGSVLVSGLLSFSIRSCIRMVILFLSNTVLYVCRLHEIGSLRKSCRYQDQYLAVSISETISVWGAALLYSISISWIVPICQYQYQHQEQYLPVSIPPSAILRDLSVSISANKLYETSVFFSLFWSYICGVITKCCTQDSNCFIYGMYTYDKVLSNMMMMMMMFCCLI